MKNVLEGLRSSEFYCPGSILRLNVDTKHPIARTMLEDTDAYFVNSSAFEATDRDRVQVVARYAKENILRSGWLLGEDKIKDKIALAEVSMGKGRDRPLRLSATASRPNVGHVSVHLERPQLQRKLTSRLILAARPSRCYCDRVRPESLPVFLFPKLTILRGALTNVRARSSHQNSRKY